MRGKLVKEIRRALVRLFELNQSRWPVGYVKNPRGQILSPRRMMYQRLKRLVREESLTQNDVKGLFR